MLRMILRPRPSFRKFGTAMNPFSHDDGKKTYVNERGMHWLIASFFIIGDVAGGGLVALPAALNNTGIYLGMIMFVVISFVSSYTASVLGENWVILLKRWPEYRTHCRKPYPAMGYRGLGRKMRRLVSYCVNATQFSIATVYLLLSSQIIQNALELLFGIRISFCWMLVVVALCLLPVTMLKSPADFWYIVMGAMITTAIAVVFILVGVAYDSMECAPHASHSLVQVNTVLIGVGTFFFSYGGHAAFPTIQHDMKQPHLFGRASYLAFFLTTLIYAPVSIVGYFTYGSNLRDSVLDSIQSVTVQTVGNSLIAIHCILTLTIVMNPLNQEVEELFKLPHEFGKERIFFRSLMMFAIVLIAETIPNFGPLLNLVGGSTIALTAIIFPCVFNLCLKVRDKSLQNGEDDMPTWKSILYESSCCDLLINGVVILFGVALGLAATYSAIIDLSTTHFTLPCYLRPIFADSSNLEGTSNFGLAHCCGPYRNISASGRPEMCILYA
ncbi:hypothetical protein QR680_001145 [Steinernema hermaphroditum]|uniref:Amino acid transporter transmembrane domain-containing protein n=1 Tax=Steinernema hermaphroditum TaxID=289476 RepID=A0AA39GYP2_9BILA|nr:hypothetical protein QR680_001145 [Steinernema hermaphroditum]